MSQIALTNRERMQSLERLGYSEREAHFLCLAALHGGYFLRRQYAQFLGCQDGGTVTQLVEKVLDLGHAEATTYKANTHIYHLFARPFYAALGQENNRNRRRKELVTIKAKLMGFDFVLAHQDREYLATEQEKVRFFQDVFQVDSGSLPAKHYASRGQITERYFVEKYPMFHSPATQPARPPVVSFCFVDPGQASVSAFETFLDRYARLFARIPEFTVIYVAATRVLFTNAQTLFERFTTGYGGTTNGAAPSVPTQPMLEYFKARRLFEAHQFSSFDRAKLIRLRDQKGEFAGPEVDAMYDRWKAGGGINFASNALAKPALPPSHSGHFSTYLLEHSYDLFGNLTAH